MSGKTGRRPTGHKPDIVRRRDAKPDGAFGKENLDRIVVGDSNRNEDKAVRRIRKIK
jgi:hypothetical protein